MNKQLKCRQIYNRCTFASVSPITLAACNLPGYHLYMYKNTVSPDAAEGATLIKVQGVCESKKEMACSVRALTRQGVKVLVFPNEELLKTWRLRLGALA